MGPIPDGRSRGTVLFLTHLPTGDLFASLISLLAWQGKVFHRDQGYLLNRVTPCGLELVKANVYGGKSWFAEGQGIILDYSQTSFIAQKIRDEIRQVAPGLYVGQAYWEDHRVLCFCLEF